MLPDSHMLFIHKLVSIVQYILAVIIICVILQVHWQQLITLPF